MIHWRDPLAAASLLTRAPLPIDHGEAGARMAAAAWAWPLVGAGVGALVGGALWAGLALGLAPLLAAAAALHEDGLSDVADGFGGGATPERRLRIMRDSRIGAFGAAALALALLARAGALAAMAPGAAVGLCVVAGAVSRALLPAMMRAGPWARPEGLAQWVGRPPAFAALGAVALAAALAAALAGVAGLAALGAAGAAAAAALALARRRIGGVTGDVLGAAQVTGEIAALAVLTAG